MKNIMLFLSILFFPLFSINGLFAQGDRAQKPNFIFILADDLGIGNVSCYGADNYQTPHIDALAKKGVRYNHAYTVPLCGPSRAMILTGRYGFRTSAVNQDNVGMIKPENEILLPTVLKSVGYVTASIGKWSQFSMTPKDFGFDNYLKFRGSGLYWSTEEGKNASYTIDDKEYILKAEEYMPDLMHRQLVGFLAENKSKPFYVHYSLSHVHGKIQKTPDSKVGSTNLYADNVHYMDKLVGSLVKVLDSLNLSKNTLVIFMGDNGTAKGYADEGTIGGKKLSGQKGSMLECGSLVPFIACWPGKIKPGVVTDDLLDGSDIFPSFAELAGAKLPTNVIIDGKSFAKRILGVGNPHRDWIFIELGNKWFVRNANWKLTRENELFDMSKAPFQETLIPSPNYTVSDKMAFQSLKKVLDNLNPAAGVLDNSADGSGRHSSNIKE